MTQLTCSAKHNLGEVSLAFETVSLIGRVDAFLINAVAVHGVIYSVDVGRLTCVCHLRGIINERLAVMNYDELLTTSEAQSYTEEPENI